MRSTILIAATGSVLATANAFGQAPAQWQLGQQLIAIGSEAPGPTQFSRIVTVLLLPDSGVVVANGDSKELRFFDARGRAVRSSGRDGAGPGEFRDLGKVFRISGDSICIHDVLLRRLSVFSPSGVFARSLTLERPPGATGVPTPVGGFADGSFASFTVLTPKPGPGQERGALYRLTAFWYQHDDSGRFRAALGQSPGGEHFLEFADGMVVQWRPPFQRVLRYAVGADRVIAGDGLEPTFVSLRTNPLSSQPISVTVRNLGLTPADVARFREEQLDRAPTPQQRTQLETSYSKTPTPTTMPAFEALRADAHGNVWMQEYRRPGATTVRWQVINALGALVATLEVPTQFLVTDIDSDRVAGIWLDENDLETIRVYQLRR